MARSILAHDPKFHVGSGHSHPSIDVVEPPDGALHWCSQCRHLPSEHRESPDLYITVETATSGHVAIPLTWREAKNLAAMLTSTVDRGVS